VRIGPPDRGGFTPMANGEAERLFNELTPEQFRLYIGLRIEAQFGEACERRDAFGRRVWIEPGEVLFGIDAVAARYGLNRDQVRRAVERFKQLGLVAARPGVVAATPPATPHGPAPAIPCGREAATPPTVLTFLTDRERCWRAERAATPPAPETATPPATPPAAVATTIQHNNQKPTNTEHEKLLPSPAAPARPRRDPTDPRFAPLRQAWERLFLAERGEPYRWQGPKDAKAIHSVIAMPVAEFEARATRGLRAQGFARCSTVAQLAAKWNDLAGPIAVNGTRPGASVPAMAAPAFAGKAGGF
jgi:hypothetical protein